MTALLDVNILIALSSPEHVHHKPASKWFESYSEGFAVCPITEGGLMRFLVRGGIPAGDALAGLNSIAALPGYEFWPDEVSVNSVSLAGIIGHRQVTDAYLAGLARARGGKIATLDSGLASAHSDVAILVQKD